MDIKLTANGDLDLLNGDLQTVQGRDETAQRLRITLTMHKGEWFLDDRVGVPYYQNIFVKNPKLDLVQAIFRQIVLLDDGVDAVEDLVLEYDSAARALTVNLVARDPDGATIEFTTLPIVEL